MASVSSGSFNTSAYSFSGGTTRYLTFKWNVLSQSEINNETTISWELVGGGTYNYGPAVADVHVEIDGAVVYDVPSTQHVSVFRGTVVASGTKTIKHNNDGSRSFEAYVECGIYINAANCSGSDSWELPTIPQASELSVSSGTLGTAQDIAVTRKSTSYTHTITYECGSASGTVCTKSTSETISFTPPLSLASQNTSGTSVSVKLILQTYSGDTAIGSEVTKTVTMAIPATVKPALEMAVSELTDYSGVYGNYVKGLSRLKIDLTPTSSYGSEIASYKVTANGSTYSAKSNITDVLSSSGTLTITATVTDKRGRTSDVVSEEITVLDYTAPAISKLTAGRCDEDGTLNDRGGYFLVTFSAAVTPLDDLNAAAYTVMYRKASASAWETSEILSDLTNVYSVTEQTWIFPAEDVPYVVGVTAQDNHSAITRTVAGTVAFYLIRPHAGGKGLGLGMTPAHSDGLDLGFPLYMNSHKLTGLAAPTADSDAASKSYVDNGFSKTTHDHDADYAPAGFGYGEKMTFYDITDGTFDEVMSEVLAGMENYTAKQIMVRDPVGLNTQRYIGTLWRYTGSWGALKVFNYGGYQAIKRFSSGAWLPWEYQNPALYDGTEYLTNEKHHYSPVYTKLIDLGTLPNTATKSVAHNLSNVTVVRYQAFATNATDGYVQEFPFHNTAGDIVGKVYYSTDGIKVVTYDDLSGYTGAIQLWYKK